MDEEPYGPPGSEQPVRPVHGVPGGYPLPAGAPEVRTSNDAWVALILAAASWLFCPVVLAIIAVVFAGRAAGEIERSGGWVTGGGMVTAAKIISWLNIGLYLVVAVIILVVLFAAVARTS